MASDAMELTRHADRALGEIPTIPVSIAPLFERAQGVLRTTPAKRDGEHVALRSLIDYRRWLIVQSRVDGSATSGPSRHQVRVHHHHHKPRKARPTVPPLTV